MKHTKCYTTILGASVVVIAAAWAVQNAQAAETWTASLTATSNDPLAKTILLQFGVAPNATDGFDIGLDLPAPPAPPSAIKLNAYFLCSHQFVKQLKTEIRKSVDTVNWQLSARADINGFALSWDISNIPAALSVMMSIGEESVDMRNLSSRSFSSGTYSLTITVGMNSPPVVSDIPNVSFPEDGSNSSIDLDNYVTDPDNTDAEIDWIHAGNTNVNVSIDSVTHVVTFTSTLNWHGSETITFTATDPGGLNDNDSMTISVVTADDTDVSLIVQTYCPVDLVVTDPADRAISKDSSAIPSAIYMEMDLDGDGDPDDRVFISDPLVGDYSIEVIPEPGADPLDTYTLDVRYGNELLRLAEDVMIHDIPAQPYTFFFPCCKMRVGWNLISLPLRPPDPYPGAVLATIDGRYNSVWAYDPETGWSVYTPEAAGDLEEMEPDRGYWINMDQTGVLILQGADPGETRISLQEGKWDLVGYTSRKARSPEDCMSSVANAIESVWEYIPGMGWYTYSPGGYSDLQLMKPARGYWIKAHQGCIWIY